MKYPLIKKFVNLVEKFLGWDYVAVILSYKETVEKFVSESFESCFK